MMSNDAKWVLYSVASIALALIAVVFVAEIIGDLAEQARDREVLEIGRKACLDRAKWTFQNKVANLEGPNSVATTEEEIEDWKSYYEKSFEKAKQECG